MRSKTNQLLLAFYLSYFAISKFVASILPISQIYISLLPIVIVLGVFFAVNIGNTKLERAPLLALMATLLILTISTLFFRNSSLYKYCYAFLVNGAVPLVLLTRIPGLDKFFPYFAYFSTATVILIGLDPIHGYKLTGDYMAYGYRAILPAFAALYLTRKYYNIRWLIPFEAASLLMIIAYANQGAILSAFALILLSNILIDQFSIKKITLLTASFITALVLLLNIKPVLEWGITTTRNNGAASYSLEKMYGSLYGNTDSLSGRSFYWHKAVIMYDNKPLLGNGIASFESVYGIYTHNIILEIAVSFGLIGVIIFIVYLMYYVARMMKTSSNKRLLYVMGLSIGLIPLLLSMQPFIWPYFWIFLVAPWVKIAVMSKKGLKATPLDKVDAPNRYKMGLAKS